MQTKFLYWTDLPDSCCKLQSGNTDNQHLAYFWRSKSSLAFSDNKPNLHDFLKNFLQFVIFLAYFFEYAICRLF